jgi:hypothetical protein
MRTTAPPISRVDGRANRATTPMLASSSNAP